MFDAYPRQRIGYFKVILPLSLVALLCLVLYAVFESGAQDDSRQESEDPSMKRMRPFLSSQTFEIGLWTRQKGGPGPASSASRSSPEVEELRQELERARVRTEEKEAELTRLRGSLGSLASLSRGATSKVGQEDSDAHPDSGPAPATAVPGPKAAAAEIPESLWREPPDTTTAAITAPPAPAPAAPAVVNLGEEIPSKESSQEAVKDSTITVKTGDKEISIQIGKEVETSSSTTLQTRGSDQMEDSGSDQVAVSTTQVASTLKANVTDTKLSPEGDGTLITVRSGQQSIVIQLRDGEQVTTSSPSTAALTTESANTTLAVENPVKALPELPELPPEPKAEEPTLEGAAVEKGDKILEAAKTELEASTTKGFSAYANLALRTR